MENNKRNFIKSPYIIELEKRKKGDPWYSNDKKPYKMRIGAHFWHALAICII